jgi:hypothetical protein
MDFSLCDVLVLIPALPVIPIAITWWLPWDRWIDWREIPPVPLGIYLIYLAFAARHFHLSTWAWGLLAIAGAAVLVVVLWKKYGT